jgi:hypothetical protein
MKERRDFKLIVLLIVGGSLSLLSFLTGWTANHLWASLTSYAIVLVIAIVFSYGVWKRQKLG